jgi:dUTP pyrophosphatase
MRDMPKAEFLRFTSLHPDAILPTRGSQYAAGLDFYSIDKVHLSPNERWLVRTGLAVAIPVGYYGRIATRSGLATNKGIDVLAGVIDADYRGEIRCLLYNTSDEVVELPAQTKICQLIIEKIITPNPEWAHSPDETIRSESGFGSTG